jgi:segregation and condensation protein B
MTEPTASSATGQPGWPPPPGPGSPAEPSGPGPTATGAEARPPAGSSGVEVPATPDRPEAQADPEGPEIGPSASPDPELPEVGASGAQGAGRVEAGEASGPGGGAGREAATGSAAQRFEGDPTAWPPDEAFDAVELDDRGWTRRDLEAILLVADEPVPAQVLAELVGSRLSEVEGLLVDLAGEYASDGRGFVLRAIAGGWRLYTNPGARTAVEAYLRAGQQSRLTRAALETLAVIAYRQPVTRFQVAAVRGVNVDGVFRTLASRGLIQEVGNDPGPGQATLYGTTPAFLEQLGLNDLDQLPPIKDYLPEGIDLLDLQDPP